MAARGLKCVLEVAARVGGCLVAGLVWSTAASASAFLEPPGAGLVITEFSASSIGRFYDSNGRLLPATSYRKFEVSSYVEYGLVPRLALILQPSGDAIRTGGPTPAHYTGFGTTDVGVKFGLWETPGTAISVQATGLVPPARSASPALVGNRDGGIDLRVLAARGTTIAGVDTFVDVEAAYRTRSDGWANEVHLDLTLGVRPVPRLLVLAQLFNVFAVSAAPNHSSWSKVQGSLVYDVAPGWSLTGGVFMTVSGREAGREIGPLAAVWYRF